MAPFTISEAVIRERSTPQSYQKGRQLARGNAVSGLRVRGAMLEAEVQGSEWVPYRVHIELPDLESATCTCPYDWGGVCKHIVAAALAYSAAPDAVERTADPTERVRALSAAEQQALLLALAGDPAVMDRVEYHLALLSTNTPATAKKASAPLAPLDVQPFRRQLQRDLRGAYRNYDDYYGAGVDLTDYFQQIETRLRQGDAVNALVLAEVVLEEYVDAVESHGFLDEESDLGDLDTLLAEALLSVDLRPAELKAWDKRLKNAVDVFEEYGGYDLLFLAPEAASLGWRDPDLAAILTGRPPVKTLAESSDLTAIRLNVLEQQGRSDEFLRLAKATSFGDRYLARLAAQGDTEAVLAEAATLLTTPTQALVVAKALAEQGADGAARTVGEQALNRAALDDETDSLGNRLSGRYDLAQWMAHRAEARGDRAEAVRLGEIAYHEQPSVVAFNHLHTLAGDDWGTLRGRLLQRLHRQPQYDQQTAVSLFLQEGLLDDAISIIERGNPHSALRLQVAEAAVGKKPEWAIATATRKAEEIMDAGQAKYYDDAISWLAVAREAWCGSGRREAWDGYVETIRAKHGRKYKLMELMRQLK